MSIRISIPGNLQNIFADGFSVEVKPLDDMWLDMEIYNRSLLTPEGWRNLFQSCVDGMARLPKEEAQEMFDSIFLPFANQKMFH